MKSIIRNIKNNKRDSILNLIGLSISFAVSILFIGHITKELNTGKTLADSSRIYRMENADDAWISKKVFDLVPNHFDEIEAQTYIQDGWSVNRFFEVDEKLIKADGSIYANESFFNVFQHKVIAGNLNTALNSQNSVVLTKSNALKLFGTTDVIGKPLKYKTTNFGEFDLTVSAIIENLPADAMLRFNAVIAVTTLHDVDWYANAVNNNWGVGCYQIFLKTKPNINKSNLESNIFNLLKNNAPDDTSSRYKKISLIKYSNLYFRNQDNFDIIAHNSKTYIYLLLVITIMILLLGGLNYINLFTAQLERKLKKFGIKKTLGATKFKIIKELTLESASLVFISFILSILLAVLMLNIFNNYTDTTLTIRDILWGKSGTRMYSTLMLTVILCGMVPGIVLAYKNPILLGKTSTDNKKKKVIFRQYPLVLQFSISIVFMLMTLFISKQVHHIQTKETGIPTENILYIEMIGDLNTKVFHEELKNIPNITAITYASNVFGKIGNDRGRVLSIAGEQQQINYKALQVDTSFFNFFGITLREGQFFNSFINGKEHLIFNQTAKNQFRINSIENAYLTANGKPRDKVIGIVNDFNFNSLHQPVQPLGFVCKKPEQLSIAYLKIEAGNVEQIGQTLAQIDDVWKKLVPGWPLEYGFLDQSISQLYERDRKFSSIMLWATVLSIIIACLGILGVTAHIIFRRTQEIGIRKVNGAKVSEILTMLNRDFVKWVAIAFVIASPIAYYAMNKWLENFAYKTELSWWIFALAGVLALGIALLTVSFQSWKAATKNPVESLRYE